ncbi:MAG: secretin and TonB N-terminal domain-containing protein [Candidatus Omnitrophica bacterium]|nr:secretin and TonB N-terminal domain-containing protein [Candidatus Omnitrophota bacterium]
MSRKKLCLILAFLALFTFTKCVYSQEITPSVDLASDKAPKNMEDVVYVKPGHVTVNFKDADISAVLNYLSEVSGVDIVTAPDVTGTVTLKLTDKPWDVALDIIVKNYGYAYEREGDIIRVVTIDSLKKAELSTEVIELNYTNAEVAHDAVKEMLTDRGKITYDTRTNSLLVTDLPTNTYRIKRVVERLDRKTPQVMIEARIFETLLEKDEKMGIDWTMRIAAIGAKRPTTIPFANWGTRDIVAHTLERFYPFGQTGSAGGTIDAAGNYVTTTGVTDFPLASTMDGTVAFPFVGTDQFTYGALDFSQFQAVLELLKQRRRTEIISNPRITTLNNQEAKILVGRVYNFPTFDQTEETGRWVISGYEAKELGIRLLVTPHVNKNREIVVELKPEISNYLGVEKISEELSAPLWSTRVADTQVMVKDGDTIFIGGLINDNTINIVKKVPLLGDLFGDIPFIGGLVKHEGVDNEKTELIFFITVHIVKDLREINRLATRNVSEVKLPGEIIGEKSEGAVVYEKEVFVELPGDTRAKTPKAKPKPLFDFRKKKKQ